MPNLTVIADSSKNRPITGLNAIVLSAPSAGTYYFYPDTIWRPGAINAGVSIQAGVEGSVTVYYTLAPRESVASTIPAVIAAVPWTTGITITAGSIDNKFPWAFTALKLVFGAAGTVYLATY